MIEGAKKTLAEAYLALLAEGGSGPITVKDVVGRAGLSRMTFYYHFHDIYDLVGCLYGDYFLTRMDEVEDVPICNRWHALAHIFVEMIEDNKLNFLDNYRHLDAAELNHRLSGSIRRIAERSFDEDPRCAKFSETDRAFLVRLITYCTIGLIDDWVNHRFDDIETEDYIERFDRLIRSQVIK